MLLAPHPFVVEAVGVPMTPCWSVLAAFADRLDVPWDGAFVHDSPLSWVARNSSKPGRPRDADCWVLHASPEWSAVHLEESADAVGPQLLMAFEMAVGRVLPEAVHQTVHRWRYSAGADPAARGVLFRRRERAGGVRRLAIGWAGRRCIPFWYCGRGMCPGQGRHPELTRDNVNYSTASCELGRPAV